MEPLTLEDAMAQAREAGVSARLLVGLRPARQDWLLGFTTSDVEPSVELVRGYGSARRVEVLTERHSSGPDRWDYPLRLDELREIYLVRLTRAETTRDVPVAPAAAALTRTHGWNDVAFAKFAEPLVDFHAFRLALNEILEAPQ